jgi:hypothetical protein
VFPVIGLSVLPAHYKSKLLKLRCKNTISASGKMKPAGCKWVDISMIRLFENLSIVCNQKI